MGRDHPNFSATQESQLNHLLATMQADPSDTTDAAALLEALEHDTPAFTANQRKRIAEKVSEKMRTVPGKRVRMSSHEQTNRYFYNYLTENDWGATLAAGATLTDIHTVLAERGAAVGYVQPTDRDFVGLNAIAQECTHKVYTADQSYAQKGELKQIWSVVRKTSNAERTLLEFPENIETFMRDYRYRYPAADPPVAPRIDVTAVLRRTMLNPCRSSHRRVTMKSHAKAEPTPSSDAAVAARALADVILFSRGGSVKAEADELTALRARAAKAEAVKSENDNRVKAAVKLEPHRGAPEMAQTVTPSASAKPSLSPPRREAQVGCGVPATRASPSIVTPGCYSAATPGVGAAPVAKDGPRAISYLDDITERIEAAVGRRKIVGKSSCPIAKRRRNAAVTGVDSAAGLGEPEPWGDDEEDEGDGRDAKDEGGDVAGRALPAAAAPATPPAVVAIKAKKAGAVMARPAAATPVLMRRPSAAKVVAAAAPGGKPPVAMAAVVAKDAPGDTPPLSKRPTSYNGGRIYFAQKRGKFGTFRCYRRSIDKVEKSIALAGARKIHAEEAWNIAINEIDTDPRPR